MRRFIALAKEKNAFIHLRTIAACSIIRSNSKEADTAQHQDHRPAATVEEVVKLPSQKAPQKTREKWPRNATSTDWYTLLPAASPNNLDRGISEVEKPIENMPQTKSDIMIILDLRVRGRR